MKFLLYPILILALIGCSPDQEDSGKSVLDALQGRWVVINYWAQWCEPCIKEIPELNEFARRYPDTAVVGVNYDGATGEELAEQLEALGVAFPTLTKDPSARLGIPRPGVLPTTLILNPEGKLVETLLGPQTLESLAQAIGKTAADG